MFRKPKPWKIQVDDDTVYLVAGMKTYAMTPREAVVIGTELASAGLTVEIETADRGATDEGEAAHA